MTFNTARNQKRPWRRASRNAPKTEELRRLSGTLLRTQDEERRRIARELHDGIAAAAGRHQHEHFGRRFGAGSPLGREALPQTVHLIERASKQIRTMSPLRHPPVLDEVGLESALQWYISGFAERSKIEATTQATEGFSKGLPRDLALALFRIIQSA